MITKIKAKIKAWVLSWDEFDSLSNLAVNTAQNCAELTLAVQRVRGITLNLKRGLGELPYPEVLAADTRIMNDKVDSLQRQLAQLQLMVLKLEAELKPEVVA